METPSNHFEVIVTGKIAYITKMLSWLMVICIVILCIAYLFFLPAEHASDEMQTAYFILTAPEFLKKAIVFAGIGLIILFPLYAYARLHRKAVLTFTPEAILIKGKKADYTLLVEGVSKIFYMDAVNLEGFSKQKLSLYFFREAGKAALRVRLKHYHKAEDVLQQLTQYENIPVHIYDFDFKYLEDKDFS